MGQNIEKCCNQTEYAQSKQLCEGGDNEKPLPQGNNILNQSRQQTEQQIYHQKLNSQYNGKQSVVKANQNQSQQNSSRDVKNMFQEQKLYLQNTSQNRQFYDQLQDNNSSYYNQYLNKSENKVAVNTVENYNNRIQELKEISQFAPVLQLTILSSATLQKGTVLTINCQQYQDSLRKIGDGFTFFGCKKRMHRTRDEQYYEKMGFNINQADPTAFNKQIIDSDDDEQLQSELKNNDENPIINDFIIPSQDAIIADRHRGIHFQIEYNISQNNYKIKDLGVGFGAFYKLDYPLILKNNHLINIGLIFMVVNLVSEKKLETVYTQQGNNKNNQYNNFNLPEKKDFCILGNQNDDINEDDEEEIENSQNLSQMNSEGKKEVKHLKIKFFGGPCQGEKVIFHAIDGRIINLGRSKDECNPHFNDSLLSKIQCHIEYNQKIGWILRDGNYVNYQINQQTVGQGKNSAVLNNYKHTQAIQNQQQNIVNGSMQEIKKVNSTNGTWLYLGEDYTIYNGMIFKANQTLFQANLV